MAALLILVTDEVERKPCYSAWGKYGCSHAVVPRRAAFGGHSATRDTGVQSEQGVQGVVGRRTRGGRRRDTLQRTWSFRNGCPPSSGDPAEVGPQLGLRGLLHP